MGRSGGRDPLHARHSEQVLASKPKQREREVLPFDHCALSYTPFEDPVANADGVVYDIGDLLPFLRTFKRDPVSGQPASAKDYTPLRFHRNADGEFHCPVTFKTFNAHTHVVAIRTTGNVYAWEAVNEMNIKAKNWRDLLTDEPFTRKDIIHIQDPMHPKASDRSTFFYQREEVVKQRKAATEGDASSSSSKEARRAQREREEQRRRVQAPGFTSTAVKSVKAIPAHERVRRVKKKAYVQMRTSEGELNFELHCDEVPKTCENFLLLATSGKYDGTKFHRLVRGFMLQGGDFTRGDGTGGESAWGRDVLLKDEIVPRLRHDALGVLSMANRGRDTNASQFFITLAPAPHLDGKHTIFGRLVNGHDVLQLIDALPCDEKNERPTKEIVLEEVVVYSNPFDEDEDDVEDEAAAEKRRQREDDLMRADETQRGAWFSNPAPVGGGDAPVGKFLGTKRVATDVAAMGDAVDQRSKRKKAKSSKSLSNFSGW